MKILLVAATSGEIETFKSKIKGKATRQGIVEYLISGVGTVQTTYALTKRLTGDIPDFIIAAGIGGGFSREIPLGTVFQVRSEVFADLGVKEASGWTDIFQLGLADRDAPPFADGRLFNPAPAMNISAVPGVGCTVNEVTTDPRRVETIEKLYSPTVESMEGAALHYVCVQEGIPFIHLRAISNMVGERDKQRWEMKGALEKLGIAIDETIETLITQH
ncbi:MAG TPA: futalosine hydrolase [Flavitalea sp.]|nr:futalosine hydrolase [Flavitalea sp.]